MMHKKWPAQWDLGAPGVQSRGPGLCHYIQELFLNCADVTLADDDTMSILADAANTMCSGSKQYVELQVDKEMRARRSPSWLARMVHEM